MLIQAILTELTKHIQVKQLDLQISMTHENIWFVSKP